MARPSGGGNDFDSEKEEFDSGGPVESGGFFNVSTNNQVFNHPPPNDSLANSANMEPVNNANFNRFSKNSLLGPPKHVQPLFGPKDNYMDMDVPNTSNFNRYPKHSLLGPPKRQFNAGDHINNYSEMEAQNNANFNRFPQGNPRFMGPPKHNQQHQFGSNDNYADMEASNNSNYNRYPPPRFMGPQKHGQRQFDRNWTNTEPYPTKKNYF